MIVFIFFLFKHKTWVRYTAAPKIIQTIYGDSINKVFQSEMSKLQDPTSLLGFKDSKKGDCKSERANGVKIRVSCVYFTNVLREVYDNEKEKLVSKASIIQSLLRANGWKGEYYDSKELISGWDYLFEPERPPSSLVQAVSNLGEEPYSKYEKKIGNTICTFSVYTNNPLSPPPRMVIDAGCFRVINIFGEPKYEIIDAY